MAGVPLLSSRTGIIEEVVEREFLLFKPEDPHDLAGALTFLMEKWACLEFGVEGMQRCILEKYNIDRSVKTLLKAYRKMSCFPSVELE